MSKRTHYERRCRVCGGRGFVGSWYGPLWFIDEECSACKGKGYQRVRMPRRKKA